MKNLDQLLQEHEYKSKSPITKLESAESKEIIAKIKALANKYDSSEVAREEKFKNISKNRLQQRFGNLRDPNYTFLNSIFN